MSKINSLMRLSEELPLNPPKPDNLARFAAIIDNAITPLERDIDALVPRGGTLPSGIFVSLEEYLSRLASLRRKLISIVYRKEVWDHVTQTHADSFTAAIQEKELAEGVQVDASACSGFSDFSGFSGFSIGDKKVDAEFEAILYSIRSTLDLLARVVSAHLQGLTDIKSYADLTKQLKKGPEDNRLSKEIVAAFDGWVAEMRLRRDASCHFVALRAMSSITTEFNSKSKRHFQTLVAIPKLASSKSVPIWHDEVPTLGPAHYSHTSMTTSDNDTVEAHAIFDREGKLIVRRNGPIPIQPEVIDGRIYVNNCIVSLELHVRAVLQLLRSGPIVCCQD